MLVTDDVRVSGRGRVDSVSDRVSEAAAVAGLLLAAVDVAAEVLED